MPDPGGFLEIDHAGLAKRGQRLPGDIVLARRLDGQGRVVGVLSDGLGSGVKANVLATLTATIAVRHAADERDPRISAAVLHRTLPVCSQRGISYATFTLLDCDADGDLRVVEYGNPPALLLRDGRAAALATESLAPSAGPGRDLRGAALRLQPGDRLIVVSDGVTQAGMGQAATPLGWGVEALARHCQEQVAGVPDLSAHRLAQGVVARACEIDGGQARDDITCAVLHLRSPRRLLLITGAPYDEADDARLAAEASAYDGRCVACGGTTADILARELGRTITMEIAEAGSRVPPAARMAGFDLVTEGMITLSRACDLLESGADRDRLGGDAAARLVRLLLGSDIIDLRVGSRINQAHQDPTLPVELGIRRNLARRLAAVLRDRYAKQVDLEFV